MNNTVSSNQQYALSTILSLALLLFLPLLYSFHYVAESTQILELTQQEQEDAVAAAISPFKFNPNTISENELHLLGLPERVTKTILMFRSKGGTFRKVEDLSKLYGMTDAAFEKLKPYIQLDK